MASLPPRRARRPLLPPATPGAPAVPVNAPAVAGAPPSPSPVRYGLPTNVVTDLLASIAENRPPVTVISDPFASFELLSSVVT